MFTLSRASTPARKAVLIVALFGVSPSNDQPIAYAQVSAISNASAQTVLNREQASAILPPSVFFHGQSASIQGRNSAGVKIGDKLVLVTLVDTSGYSSAVQQTYQAYLLTEVPLMFGPQRLPAGAYGFGFVNGTEMVVMDVGGGELLRVKINKDETLTRPNPLQILKGGAGEGFRLYLGRTYAMFSPMDK